MLVRARATTSQLTTVSGKLQQLSDWLVASHLTPWLFVLLCAVAYAEAAFFLGFVLPGETALLLGGVLCAGGVLPLWAFLPAAILAAILGDSTGYAVGHHFGERIKSSRPGLIVGAPRWMVAEAFVHQHGGKAVFFGRGQAFLRALVPALAGVARMRYRVFLPWNAAGAVVWGGGVVLLGYLFGHSLKKVEEVLGVVGVALVLVLVGLFLLWRHRRRKSMTRWEGARHPRELDPSGEPGTSDPHDA